MSVNKATLIGHVGKDPEVRELDGGKVVATFSLATTERGFTLPNGTSVPERTEWHNVVTWNGLAKVVQQYVRKGSQLYIEGKIRTRTYEKNEQKFYVTEIFADDMQMLGAKPQAPQAQQPAPQQPMQQQPMQQYQQQPQQYQQPQQNYQQGTIPPWENPYNTPF